MAKYDNLKHTVELTDEQVAAIRLRLPDGPLKGFLLTIQMRGRKKLDEEPEEALRLAMGRNAADVDNVIERLRSSGWDVAKKP